jgi:hypothetical protein
VAHRGTHCSLYAIYMYMGQKNIFVFKKNKIA